MKRRLISAVLILGTFLACQKTISWDLSPAAKAYIAKDAFDNCLPIPVSGIYKVNSALTDSNYLTVQVMVDSPGSYNMYTSFVNGYHFTGTGAFTKAGLTEVKLVGAGTPVLSKTDSFTVYLNSSTCGFSVFVLPADADSTASFELVGDTLGNCSNTVINGTYALNQPLTDSNFVVLQVNVIKAGVYNLTTGVINGMSFASSGTFISTGLQNITLLGSGTPSVPGDNPVPITVDSTNCSFAINVQ